jgi:hypothetical protein
VNRVADEDLAQLGFGVIRIDVNARGRIHKDRERFLERDARALRDWRSPSRGPIRIQPRSYVTAASVPYARARGRGIPSWTPRVIMIVLRILEARDERRGAGVGGRIRAFSKEGSPGGAGPRIRCPRCGWEPERDSRWSCTCLHSWNTFDTEGLCPACGRQWAETQCLRCHQWSPHREWYGDGPGRPGRDEPEP